MVVFWLLQISLKSSFSDAEAFNDAPVAESGQETVQKDSLPKLIPISNSKKHLLSNGQCFESGSGIFLGHGSGSGGGKKRA